MLEPIKPNYEIEVALDKDSYIVGETINGNAKVNLKKEVNARAVYVVLRKIEVHMGLPSRRLRSEPYEVVVYEDKKELAPTGTYSGAREYAFNFAIPREPRNSIMLQMKNWERLINLLIIFALIALGAAGTIYNVGEPRITHPTPSSTVQEGGNIIIAAISALIAIVGVVRLVQKPEQVKWGVSFHMDVPYGFDVCKNKDLTIKA